MDYLVTGGAGFIGSNLVDVLLRDGSQVTVVDNFDPFYASAFKRENLVSASRYHNFRFINADICEADDLESIAGHYDCIVHLAGRGGIRPSIQDPVAYQHINGHGTQNMLEFARKHGVLQFVFASSSSVYGNNPLIPWKEDTSRLWPISPYAATKISGEMLGHVYSHLYGIRFIALRFFTVYGPRQRPDLAIRKFAEMIIAGQTIPVYGDGSSRRDYTFIDDIIAGIFASMKYCASDYEIINLGNNHPTQLMEMVRVLEEMLGRAAVVEFLPEQPGDLATTCGDLEKARRLLGYAPQTSFVEGMARFTEWFLSNPPVECAPRQEVRRCSRLSTALLPPRTTRTASEA